MGPGYGVPYGNQIPEVDEDDDEFEDLQLFPFDEPTEDDVLWMAQLMGIHPVRDKQFMHLAQEALINPPTDEWMIFKDIAGNVIWINDITEEMEPHPPHLELLIENFQRVKKKTAEMNNRNPSNDKSNAMKKILGRNLSSVDPLEASLSNSQTLANSIQQPPPGKTGPGLNSRPAPLPQRGAAPPPPPVQPKTAPPPAKASTPSPPPQQKKPEPAVAQPPPPAATPTPSGSRRGGAMALMKAIQFANSEAGNEEQPPAPPPKKKEPEVLPPDEDEEQENSDAVFDRRLGEDHHSDGDKSEVEEEDSDEKGMLAGDAEDMEDEEGDGLEDYSDPEVEEDLKNTHQDWAKLNPKKTVKEEPKPSPKQKTEPEKKHQQNPKEPSQKQKPSQAASKKEKEQLTISQVADAETSKIQSKILSDMQEMQLKMSMMEQENKALKKQYQEIITSRAAPASQQPSQIISQQLNNIQSQLRPEEDSNIKNGIAEIKKLLEQSILIQNDRLTNADENRSVVIGNEQGHFGRPVYSVHSHEQHSQQGGGHTHHQDSSFKPQQQMNNFSRMAGTELDTKWSSIISREKEHLSNCKLALHNEKLVLENRKLAIKKHEFEMRKELEQMRLERGHPLSNKIKENLNQQLAIFKTEFAAWKDKCLRFSMKQKNLALLEKSYNFSRSTGPANDATDRHLEELYSIYREGLIEDSLPDHDALAPPADDGLSLDSHPYDLESEAHNFDDNQSKQSRTGNQSSTPGETPYPEHLPRAPVHAEPPELANYKSSTSSSYTPSMYNGGYSEPKENIRKYFANQSRFYDSMRREVAN
jgi:hypothetical protein